MKFVFIFLFTLTLQMVVSQEGLDVYTSLTEAPTEESNFDESMINAEFSGFGEFSMIRAASVRKDNEEEIGTLKAMIVEASKLGETLIETTKSVGRVNAQRIEDAQLRTVDDAFRLMGNVRQSQFSDSGFVIRGINSEAPDAGNYTGTQTPLSTIFVDGVALTQEAARRGPTGLWDVRSVEVLRGPQSTLQGRNSLAGSVNIQTQDPSYEWEGAARLTYGDHDSFEQAAMLNVPLSDFLALRFTAEHAERDSFIDAPGLKDFPRFDDFTTSQSLIYRGKALFEPDQIPLRSVLTYTFSESRPTSNDAFGPDFFDREWRSVSGSQQVRETKNHTAAWLNTYELTDTVTLTLLSTLADTELHVGQIDGNTVRVDDENEYSQEIRANWDEAWGKSVLGVYGNFSEGESTLSNIRKQRRNAALFGEVDYYLTDSLHLIAGGRLDYDDFEFEVAGDEVSTSNTEFLPKFGIQYEFSDIHNIGLTVQRGYRHGGVGIGLGGEPNSFDPSKTWHYELAYRNSFFDERLSLAANVFYTQWSDQQVVVRDIDNASLEIDERILNAGESSLYGAEFELGYEATDNLRFTGSIGLLKTRFDDFTLGIDPEVAAFLNVPSTIDFGGYEFPESPELNASIGMDYRHDSGFFFTTDLKYLSSYFSPVLFAPLGSGLGGVSVQAPQSSVVEVDANVTVNLSFGYEAENWKFVVFVQNLFDEEYLVGKVPSAIRNGDNSITFKDDFLATVGQPRYIGAAFEARF